jgi:hypothetical protein
MSHGLPTLTLTSGRKIGAEVIFAYRTYENLLVGIPTERLNAAHFSVAPSTNEGALF